MKISYNWLKQFLHFDWEVVKTGELLTDLGLEVEGIQNYESVRGGLDGVVIGEVLTCDQHPNADRLKITTVDIGTSDPLQIVCGAPNVAVGQKVPVAVMGTTLFDERGSAFKIKKGKIRGKESFGMICAEDELGLGSNHDGILVLDEKVKVGTKAAEAFDIQTDHIFEIGLTPNRSDAMSHLGVARDLRAGLSQYGINLELISPSVSDFHLDQAIFRIDVEVECKELVPRYCGISMVDIEIKDSPMWIQNRLKAVGITPKNNVVDITNYVLHELGQPLHAFDADQIKGNKVLVKRLDLGTKFLTLDQQERELHSEDIVICDAESNPLCIAGVYGGLHSGVSEKTTAIFLESAYFDPVSVRKTAKRHALNTDASFRFERGININHTEYALKRAAILIKEYANGKISSNVVDCYPEKIEDFQVFLTYKNCFRLIGQELDKELIKNILVSLEIRINTETELGLGLMVPSYRLDVKREADVIEEILRVYGYNNINFSHKLNSSISHDNNRALPLQNIVSAHLTCLGFYENMSNSLTKADYLSLTKDLKPESNVKIVNPLSSDLNVMRQSLLFSGLESVLYNLNRKNNFLRLFEFGTTYHKFDTGYQEVKHLSLLVTGDSMQGHWKIAKERSDFFYLKGIVVALLERIGLINLKTSPAKSDVFSEAIMFSVDKKKLVEFGVLKKRISKAFAIKQEVFFADFNWSAVTSLSGTSKISFSKLPKFPSLRRDLALLIDQKITFKEINRLAFQSERKLLKGVDLFDVYQGAKLPEGKKSYGVSFLFQDATKTLTDKQVDKIMKKLLHTFEKNLEATLR